LLKKVKDEVENEVLPGDVNLMHVESWNQYKYLFIKDLDRDEWEAVNDFYSRCKLIDEAISYNKTFFQKNEEQFRVNKNRAAADYAKESVEAFYRGENVAVKDVAEEKYKKFDEIFMEINELYSPRKPILDAKKHIQKLNLSISFGSVGSKLKRMAKIRP